MVLEFFYSLAQQIVELGALGIFLGMFLESSIVPIPSEVVLVGAGAIGFSIFDITLYGTLGSTLGAVFGYTIGRCGGRPFLRKFGKYFFITEKKMKFFDNWFERWGIYSVLISRLIPLVPYKVFSIGAGIAKMKFVPFIVFTFIGTIPRTFVLGYFGQLLFTTRNILYMVVLLAVFVVLPLAIARYISKGSNGKSRIVTKSK